jgi:RNA-splicing ligase RtcB
MRGDIVSGLTTICLDFLLTIITAEANPECPVHVLAHQAQLDQLSVAQLEKTARTLPGIIHAAGQPDLHPGTKFPIGAVFVSQKWIHPPLIGGDIGCGMAWYKTTLSRQQVDGDKGKKVAEKLRGLEGAWRTQAEREIWLKDETGSCSAGREWDQAVGTIGAGNHFAEIQVIEEITAVNNGQGFAEGNVILLVHSGSRGFGGSVLKKFTSDSQDSLHEDSEQAKNYLKVHDTACRWAQANRDLIALRFLSCLEPGEPAWELGRNSSDTTTSNDAVLHVKASLQDRKVVDIWHNNVERVKWPPSPPGSATAAPLEQVKYVYIHRKGAAPTYNPRTKAPLTILPLPGSRGTPTMMLKPRFSESTSWGLTNALSLAHGAGRSMSRAKALASLSQKYKDHNLLEPSRGGDGTWVVCDEKNLIYEEAPEAYKDVYAVAEDLVSEGVGEVMGWCRARVSYKVRDEGR